MIGPIGVKGTQVAFLKMIYILWKFILLGRRAFSQPEGLFEWDIYICAALDHASLSVADKFERPSRRVQNEGRF